MVTEEAQDVMARQSSRKENENKKYKRLQLRIIEKQRLMIDEQQQIIDSSNPQKKKTKGN